MEDLSKGVILSIVQMKIKPTICLRLIYKIVLVNKERNISRSDSGVVTWPEMKYGKLYKRKKTSTLVDPACHFHSAYIIYL